MFFLFSGEGPTDLECCNIITELCLGDDFEQGPMTMIVDQIVRAKHQYTFLETGHCGFVSERTLAMQAKALKVPKKSMGLPGKKTPQETRYFFNNARCLSRIAIALQVELNDDVVAILFRDADRTNSTSRGAYVDKVQSMLNGFQAENFPRGVPMMPNPKSEAWLLCILKFGCENCLALEERSGNDRSPNSLKKELEELIGQAPSREVLNDLFLAAEFKLEQISMPSFVAFKSRLEEVL